MFCKSHNSKMLEQIALSISTAIFFLCTLIVSSIMPSEPVIASPNEDIAVMASAESSFPENFSLVGKWKGEGKVVEFTDNGEMLYDGISARYRLDGEKLTIIANINGTSREYTMTLDIIDGRNVVLGAISLHKVEQPS